MKLHERHDQITSGGIAIRLAVSNAAKQHALTHGEVIHILAAIILSWATSAVRAERGERQVGE
jgi:hypothetical protein